jgi:hypothetical protein
MATSSPLAVPWEDQQLVLYAVAGAALAWCAVRALEWAWWRPRRLERALRSQGLRGTAYRSLAGDMPLLVRLNKEARSRTMPLGCHDVVPRALPLFHQAMKEHGACSCFFSACLFWPPTTNWLWPQGPFIDLSGDDDDE